MYERGSLLLNTQSIMSIMTRKKDATPIHTLYTARYPMNWLQFRSRSKETVAVGNVTTFDGTFRVRL